VALVLISLFQLGNLLKSKEYSFIDVNTIESKRLYEKEESVVETYFIAMYVDTIENNQSTVENKQKALDKCITKIVWAVIFVASAALVNKIIGGI